MAKAEMEMEIAIHIDDDEVKHTYNSGYQAAIADVREAIKRYGDLPFEFEGKMYYITDDPLWQKMKVDLMQVAEALLEDKQEGQSIAGGLRCR